MVRPRVARGSVNLADAVLHQCIRPLIGACGAPGHHGYQRACELISGQASNGPFGSPGFACAGKTDPPSSSHPLADLGGYSCMNRSCGSVQASPMVSLSRTSATKTSIGAIDCSSVQPANSPLRALNLV